MVTIPKKQAVLALAISSALALSACGGSDDSGTSGGGNIGGGGGTVQPGGVIITAMDGYFLNAAVFVDSNNNGMWDTNQEAVLGLTDAKGQVKLTKEPEGTLAIQTIVPNGQMQQALIEQDPAKYAGKYTVDMDHPSQPMEHEIVLRSPNKGEDKVTISPLTDLVMIHVGENADDEAAIAEAEQKVAAQLNVENVYVNYIETDNKELHKTAQILTETKATDSNYADKVEEIVEEAVTVVGDMTEEEVEDPDFKPVVDGDIATPPTVDYKTVVIEESAKAIQAELNTFNVDLQTSAPAEGISVSADIATLFQDKDIKNDAGEPLPFASTDMTLDATQLIAAGIEVKFENNQLVVSLAPNTKPTKAGVFNIEITLNPQDKVTETTAIFSVEVEKGIALPPEAEQAVITSLKSQINDWSLTEGEAFFGPLDYSEVQSIFENNVQIEVGTNATANGLELIYEGTMRQFTKFGLAGTPTNPAAAGEFYIWVSGKAENGLVTQVNLPLPLIAEAPEVIPPPPEDNTPKFKPEHFEKGGIWRMGSFNAGDSEVGYASLRNSNGQYEFCWDSASTLSQNGWSHALSSLNQNAPANETEIVRCDAVTLHEDGSFTYDNEKMGAFKLAYEHKENDQYKLLFTVDNGLFWLDSSAEDFAHSLKVPAKDGYNEVSLVDDNTSRESIDAMLAINAFAADTVEMVNADSPEETMSATWTIETDSVGESLMLTETVDNGTQQREIFYVRDFGSVSVTIEDKHANDNSANFGLKSENEELLRDIKEAWQPAPTTPATEFENKVWFSTEHGNGNGTENNFTNSVAWCDTSYFKDGIAYGNDRSMENRTVCTDDKNALVEYGTYVIDGPYLTVSMPSDNGDAPETSKLSFADNAATINGAKMVNAWDERYAYFTDKAAAEQRLNAKSSDAAQYRDAPMELPNLESDTYSTGTMSARIRDGYFGFSIDQAKGRSFTCEEFNEFYESMYVTDGYNYISSTCQNSVENGITHTSFSFNGTPEAGVQYSFIARVKGHQQPLVEAIKYGLKN
ncbi:hypothetical protein [Enterovibrio norvegicus]|uniref:Acid phosphatase n=1 Tax=Enterovibrio norvegicus TaxID=188144 RepID=A0A2N7L8T6_9GAMM|nr:hypothetical protein [Enterovibrio norvegicus]PMN90704.1 hypothetical protein BCT23_04255 [Enterovibrio norvegicus]